MPPKAFALRSVWSGEDPFSSQTHGKGNGGILERGETVSGKNLDGPAKKVRQGGGGLLERVCMATGGD